jgi:hypothetical protein
MIPIPDKETLEALNRARTMKQLTFELLTELVLRNTTHRGLYDELLPYLKDVEETPQPYDNIVQPEQKATVTPFIHDVTTIPSRLEIALKFMFNEPIMPLQSALELADELIKQSKDGQEPLKLCTGCDHRSDVHIKKPGIACCPDSNYIPLDEYLKHSTYNKL